MIMDNFDSPFLYNRPQMTVEAIKKSIEIGPSLYPRTFIPLINSFEFYAYFVEKQA